MKFSEQILISDEIRIALEKHRPVVALETAVITHGLPNPTNFEMAQSVESLIRQADVIPATIGLFEGKVRIGLPIEILAMLSNTPNLKKISTHNLGIATLRKWSGGTTVAATMHIAKIAGIKVFSTGGIGGVHRNHALDVSADIPELGRNPMIVVCSGAKAILDLPATLEILETHGVPVIGYRTDELPAFYSSKSGLPVDIRLDAASEIADAALAHWNLDLLSALLVCNPPPDAFDIPSQDIENVIQKALMDAESEHITSPKVTPFLLDRVRIQTDGESLKSNIALLQSNARLAAEIAIALQEKNTRYRSESIL